MRRASMLACLGTLACAATPERKPDAQVEPTRAASKACSGELQPLRRYVAILAVSDVHEGPDGRSQRSVVAREALTLPVFDALEADFVDVRFTVSPGFDEVFSVDVGRVWHQAAIEDVAPAEAGWILPDQAGLGRLVAPRDVDALAGDVLPAAARIAESGLTTPQSLECLDGPAPHPRGHRHRWAVWIRGEFDGTPVSERVELEFDTPAAFDPGGTAASFVWQQGDYVLRGHAWLAASYEPGWRTNAKVRVHVEDSLGRSFDETGGAVASAAVFPGSAGELGLGTLQLGTFPSGASREAVAAGARVEGKRTWSGSCSGDDGCPDGQPCVEGRCIVEEACVRGPDACFESGDRVQCRCANGAATDHWKGLETPDPFLRLCTALLHTCRSGSSVTLEGEGPPVTLSFAPVLSIAHER